MNTKDTPTPEEIAQAWNWAQNTSDAPFRVVRFEFSADRYAELLAAYAAHVRSEAQKLRDRVKELEDALDGLRLVIGLTPVLGNKEALQEAVNVAQRALNPNT